MANNVNFQVKNGLTVGTGGSILISTGNSVGIGTTTPNTALQVSGTITGTTFSGSASGLTSVPAGQLTGTISSGVLGNSSVYIGSTSVALNRTTGYLQLSSVDIVGTATTSTNQSGGTVNASTGSFSGQITAATGSASAPSYSFTGDTGTGIYRPSANNISISTGGTGRLFVDSSGLVGIGTNNPSSGLHLANATAGSAANFTLSNPANNWSIKTGTTENALVFYENQFSSEKVRIDFSGRVGIGTSSPGNQNTTQVTSDNDGIRVQLAATPSGGQGPRLIFGHNTNNGTPQIFAAIKSLMGSGNDAAWSSDLAFYTGGSSLAERLRIDGAGKVGIGTASPSATLDVAGSTYFRTVLGLNIPNSLNKILDGTNGSPPASGGTAFNALSLLPSTFTNQVNRVVLVYKASDNSSTYNISPLLFTSKTYSSNYGQGYYIGVFDYNGSTWVQDGSWLQIGHPPAGAGFNLAFPDSAGGVTKNANYTQYVAVIQYAVVSYDLFLSMGGFNVIDTNFNQTKFLTAGIERVRIDSSGKVGIGTASPGVTLQVQGAINVGNQAQGDGTTTIVSARGLFIGTNQNTGSSTEVFLQTNAYPIQPAGLSSPSQAFVFSGWSGGGIWHNAIKSGQGQFLSFHTGISANTYTDTNERLRIDSSGNVGIGTASPGSLLDLRFATNPVTDNGVGTNALRVWTSSALAADTGGALSLGGVTGGSSSAFGQIAGRKANATSNDYAGYLQFATNTPVGTMAERMRIDSSGRVGIGTASPGSLLHVYGGDARVQKGVNFTDVSEITLANTYRTGRILSAYTNYVSVTETYIAFCTNITGQANDTVGETMRLAGGKLGIGTSSPGYKLTVQSDSADTSYATPYNNYGIIIRNDDQTNNNYSGFSFNTKDSLGSDNTMAAIAAQCTNHTSGATNGTLAFFTTGSGTLTERARIDSSGRLLVGTSSVSQDSTLVLQGRSSSSSGSAVIRLNVGTAIPADNDALGYLCFGDSSSCDAAYVWAQRDGGTWSGSSKPTRLVFSTTPSGSASPTERMRITSTGFLKVSNTGSYAITAVGTPNSHEVNQSLDNIAAFHAVHSGATGPYGYYYKSTAADPNNTSYYVFGAFQNTNVNIYTIWSNGTVSARSDIRYKKNVETTRNGYLEDLSRLRVVKYNWYNHEDDAPKELGFIAQEVEEVFPGLVLSQPETDSEGNETGEVCKSIKFSVFTPMLVKALQEAMERIETLEAKVAALETK